MKPQHELGFEVYPQDLLGYYPWREAVKAAEALGDGWRLPTKDEVDKMYLKQEKIGGFGAAYYWSSLEYGERYAWNRGFGKGNWFYSASKTTRRRVRPVRDIPLTRDHDETVEARLRVDPEYAVALYHEQRKQIEELEAQIQAERITSLECALKDIAAYAYEQRKQIEELEAQNLDMIRDFYENGYDENECGEIILKYGGDA